MNLEWLALALLAPLFWAFSNNIDAALRRHFVKSDWAMTWIMAVARLPAALILIAMGGFEYPNIEAVFFMFLGGFLWIAPFWMYFKAIHREEVSRVALLIQLSPIFTLFIAFLLLKETLDPLQSIAFALLLSGGLLAVVKKFEGKWRFNRVALFWIMAADILWSLADVLFKKYAPDFSNFYAAYAIFTLSGFAFSLIFLVTQKGRTKILAHFKGLPGRAWVMLVIDQISSVLGSLIFAYALTLGHASLTAVFIGIQPLLAIGWSLLLASRINEIEKEKIAHSDLMIKGAAMVLIAIGLAFLV
ncbi:DMT family transporter [Candidatus Peregrinibacteria bacterium]|nr:DMT family transporter [Candidatus Peregrinibacteria bacterium]